LVAASPLGKCLRVLTTLRNSELMLSIRFVAQPAKFGIDKPE